MIKILLAAVIVAVSGGIFYARYTGEDNARNSASGTELPQSGTESSLDSSRKLDNNLQINDNAAAAPGSTITLQPDVTSVKANEAGRSVSVVSDIADNKEAIDAEQTSAANTTESTPAYLIGHAAVGDAEFNNIAAQMRANPEMLRGIMEEFRIETDPQRLTRLSSLLGKVDSDELAPLATDMIFSGNEASRTAGFDLLRRVQVRDPRARNVVLDLLSSETDSTVLVQALNVLAIPADVSDEETRNIVNRIEPLLESNDPHVRVQSISIMSSWSKDETVTPALLRALEDSDSRVRQGAAYALASNTDRSPLVQQALFGLLENPAEAHRARRGAALALHQFDLDEYNTERLAAAELQLAAR